MKPCFASGRKWHALISDMEVRMFNPKGYYAGSSYVGFLPDGHRMRFPTEQEYLDYIAGVIEDAA